MTLIKIVFLYLVLLTSLRSVPAYADFWGGDLPLLAEIVVNTLQQISKLGDIIGQAKENLEYFQDLNKGIRDALNLAKTMNQKLAPGVLSDLQGAEQALAVIEQLYGATPKTSEARMQQTMVMSLFLPTTAHIDGMASHIKVDTRVRHFTAQDSYTSNRRRLTTEWEKMPHAIREDYDLKWAIAAAIFMQRN